MTREQLLRAVRDLVVAATGLDARKVIEYQPPGKGARPPLPYVSVHILTQGQRGRDGAYVTDTENDDGTFDVTVSGQRVATVSLGAYGTSSYDLLEATRTIRSHETLRELQRDLGVAVRRMSDVTDTTVTRDGSRYEQGASVTMTIAYATTSTDTTDIVESITGSGAAGSDLDTLGLTIEVP